VKLEVVADGAVIREGIDLAFEERVEDSSWLAIRSGAAHTGPVYITVDGRKPLSVSAVESFKKRFQKLEEYVKSRAFFATDEQAASVMSSIQRGYDYLEERINEPLTPDPWAEDRRLMVEAQLRRRNIQDENVLRVMEKVPRHLFVPAERERESYADHHVPIGYGQTILAPYIVARMTELLALTGKEKVLEIGTGSGYQAAILAELARDVYTIEIIEPLEQRAQTLLKDLGYHNVNVRYGDGYRGWPEEQPFDAVIVTAAPSHVPPALVDQLARGGRMVVPIGIEVQKLRLITKDQDGTIRQRDLDPVYFVPMTGEAEEKRRGQTE
jgi:protein-L-isoaspartate(D-aspartate) O-methyltransferase